MLLNLKIYIYSILVFFIVFAFPFLPFLNSAKIVVLYILILFLLTNSIGKNMRCFSDHFSHLTFIYYLVFLYTFGITVIWMAYDWSLTSRVISSFLLYFISFSFFRYASRYVKVEKVVVYCFVVQSAIIIIS